MTDIVALDKELDEIARETKIDESKIAIFDSYMRRLASVLPKEYLYLSWRFMGVCIEVEVYTPLHNPEIKIQIRGSRDAPVSASIEATPNGVQGKRRFLIYAKYLRKIIPILSATYKALYREINKDLREVLDQIAPYVVSEELSTE